MSVTICPAQMGFQIVYFEENERVKWQFLSGPHEWIGTDDTFDLKQEGGDVVQFSHNDWGEPVEFNASAV